MNRIRKHWKGSSMISKFVLIFSIIPTLYILFLILGTIFGRLENEDWFFNLLGEQTSMKLWEDYTSVYFGGWEEIGLYFFLPLYLAYLFLVYIGLKYKKSSEIISKISLLLGLISTICIIKFEMFEGI